MESGQAEHPFAEAFDSPKPIDAGVKILFRFCAGPLISCLLKPFEDIVHLKRFAGFPDDGNHSRSERSAWRFRPGAAFEGVGPAAGFGCAGGIARGVANASGSAF